MMLQSVSPDIVQPIVDEFTNLYFSSFSQTWMNTFWLGVPVQKLPFDLWVYQEILHEIKPDIIIETGTLFGGSALYMASILDLLHNGRIVSIDIEEREGRPQHERITYLRGSSTGAEILQVVDDMIKPGDKIVVILDSDHSAQHVLDELRIYNKYVTHGSYLIVEDTCMNGHPILSGSGPGPMEGLAEFLQENDDFIVDETKEKFFVTWNPKGYLKKVK